MDKFTELVNELKEITPFAYCIRSPIYYWSVEDDSIVGSAVRSNAIIIPLSLSTEERQGWCDKLNAATKEVHAGSIFSLVGHEHKISMIKELRTAMGFGLKEAKQMVENYLSTGKMKTLPFILYSGVPELEGYGYFPLCENQPCPMEMAEVLGYSIAIEKQQVTPCTHWGVVFSSGSYRVVPHFPEDAALGWDGESVIIIINQPRPEDILYSSTDKAIVAEVALLMNKAFLKGRSTAITAVSNLINAL